MHIIGFCIFYAGSGNTMYGCSEQTATSKTCVLGVQVYLKTFQKTFHKNNNSGNEISFEQSLVILVLEQGWTISFVIRPNKKQSSYTL
jgi:hypothetical protein